MTGRILDHAPIAIPNSATKERESSHPRTTGFSCVAPDAVGQAQERLQPRQLAAAVQRDVVPALGARDHRAHGDDQDIDQAMLDLARTARIFDRCKVLDQLLHRHRRPPFVAEEITGTACQTVRSCSPFSCVAPGLKTWKPASTRASTAGGPAKSSTFVTSATLRSAMASSCSFAGVMTADTPMPAISPGRSDAGPQSRTAA